MIQKIHIAILALIFVGLMFADNFFPPLGAAFCAILIYLWVTRLFKSWLLRLAERFRRAPMRYPAYRRRKVVTYSSGFLLPWVNMLVKFFKKPIRGSSHSESQVPLKNDAELSFSESGNIFDKSFGGTRSHCSVHREPLASDEFKTFVWNISENYIKSWYKYLSKDDEFPKEMEDVLEDCFASALYRISRLNLNQLANQLLIIVFNHLLIFSKKKRRIRTRKNLLGAKGFDLKLSHPAMRDQKSEIVYLLNVCEILVDMVVPSKLLRCHLSRAAITDILTKQLLTPVVNLLTDPCWLMWGIAYLLGGQDLIDNASPVEESAKDFSSAKSSAKEYQEIEPCDNPKKKLSVKLSKSKSFSFDSLDDIGKNHLSSDQKEFGRSVENINVSTPKIEKRRASRSPNITIATSSPTNEAGYSSKEEFSPDYKALPMYSLYPVLQPKAYKAINNCKSVPSPLYDLLPKKKSPSKLKCSFSLDTISSFAATGLESVQQSVFQSSPSAQNLYAKESDSDFNRDTVTEKSTKLQIPDTPDVEEAEEVTEIMNLEPFQNVRIDGTKEQLDPRNKIYILYSIKYEYLKSEENDEGDIQIVERTGHAERRFKEFIALQSKLEQPEFKKYMRGIEGPSKWLSMTISPKDKRNIEKRRVFLEKYLQTLCKREVLKNNPDLHEFLGYKSDPSIAFVKNAADFPVQRILSKMMGSAFDLIKTALPIMPDGIDTCDISPNSTSEKSPNTSRSLLPSFKTNKSKAKLLTLTFVPNRVTCLGDEMKAYLRDLFDSLSPENSRPHTPDNLENLQGPKSGIFPCSFSSDSQPAWKRKAAELCDPPMGPRVQGDGCDSLENKSVEDFLKEFNYIKFQNLQRTFQNDIPLANTLIDIVLTVLFPAHALSDDYMTVAFKVLFGDLVQTWFQKQLNYLTKSEPWALCLHKLHEALWPSNDNATKQSTDLTSCKLAALHALKMIFPEALSYVIGKNELHKSLETFLDSILCETYNRNLLYQIIDVIIEMLCAQELQSAQ